MRRVYTTSRIVECVWSTSSVNTVIGMKPTPLCIVFVLFFFCYVYLWIALFFCWVIDYYYYFNISLPGPIELVPSATFFIMFFNLSLLSAVVRHRLWILHCANVPGHECGSSIWVLVGRWGQGQGTAETLGTGLHWCTHDLGGGAVKRSKYLSLGCGAVVS